MQDFSKFPNQGVRDRAASQWLVDATNPLSDHPRALHPRTMQLLLQVAQRAVSIATEFRRARGEDSQGDIDVTQHVMDLANVHYHRGLMLHAMLLADASDFAHDVARIHQNVDRVAGGIPLSVPLYFAESGEKPAGAILRH